VQLYVRDDLIDIEKLYVRTDALHTIGRMHGAAAIQHTRLLPDAASFYEEWQAVEEQQTGETEARAMLRPN
jgi:hypothetical protein